MHSVSKEGTVVGGRVRVDTESDEAMAVISSSSSVGAPKVRTAREAVFLRFLMAVAGGDKISARYWSSASDVKVEPRSRYQTLGHVYVDSHEVATRHRTDTAS